MPGKFHIAIFINLFSLFIFVIHWGVIKRNYEDNHKLSLAVIVLITNEQLIIEDISFQNIFLNVHYLPLLALNVGTFVNNFFIKMFEISSVLQRYLKTTWETCQYFPCRSWL